LFDTTNFAVKIAGEIKNFDLRDYFGSACKPQRLARQTQLGLVACRMAIEHAGLTKEVLQKAEPVPLIVGISSSAVDIIEQVKEIVMTLGPSRVRPYMAGACQPFSIGAALVQLLGVQASVTTISAACPSGLDAVAVAARKIRDGISDLVVVGAADSPLNAPTIAAFIKAGLPSLTTEFAPQEVSRPFDAKRSGVVLSEGAGFIVLERLDSALARGATPYMEIVGGSTVTDTPGSENMAGLFHSMQFSMTNAGIYPEQIDYVCANATSDRRGDKIETEQLKQVLGRKAYQTPISSIRGVAGHGLAPAGMFQIITCALAMANQTIPPTANLTTPDPDCDLDYVPLSPRKGNLNIALANSHGLGGENSTIIMKRVS